MRERRGDVDQVLLAMPSLSRSQRRRIVDDLQPLGIPVLQVPSVEEITSGRTRIDDLRPVAIEELLGPGIAGQVVLVSGAGGSIGAELCRQILALRPRRLVLLERSEPSLYGIDQELRRSLPAGVELVAVFGSATDGQLVSRVLQEQAVQVVFHAAAYKHVPLVQANPLSGLANNVLGTLVLARAAARSGVASFTLISTDKAVRPTNVMGASKRAAELVIQAAVLARGGDLFLLDMGEPVRILDLAKQMVRLSGLSLRDAQHPEGDIEIVCTGLRPGEKLYEELLIDAESEPTSHPLIFRATERAIPPSSSGLRSRPWRPPFAAKTPMPPSTCWPSWCPSGSGVRLGASPSRPIQWRWLKTEACGLFSRSSLLLPNLCVYAHKIDIVHFPCVALVGSLAVAGCRRGQSSPKA